jgi:predicted site-specific integrase-resolvase
MKLSKYAKMLGVSYRTVWNHHHQGKIPGSYALPSGTIIVPDGILEQPKEHSTKKVCIYARVSSSNRKNQLDAQAERLEQYCTQQGWQITKIVKDIASGLNDNRSKLISIIKSIEEYDHVVVEHKDRLTRIGFNYFETFYPNKFHVVNVAKDEVEDLTQDLVAIITSFCARLYGKRKGKQKTENIIKELEKDDS